MVSNQTDAPIIDVVMACYQEPIPWLEMAIDSILGQTEQRFTFIIVLDDPENKSIAECLASYEKRDSRIRVIYNRENLGLAASLQVGIKNGTGKYIARMDADDISEPQRLEIQLACLTQNTQLGLIGSAIVNIDEHGNSLGIKQFERDPELLKKMIPFCSVACHPTWMLTRESYEAVGGYRNLSTAQDYDFLYRLLDANIGISNLPEPLIRYRIHNSSITSGMSLKRYKIRQYIHKMHHDRVTLGQDNFSETELQRFVDQARVKPVVSKLLTKLRQAEERKSISKVIYLGLLAVLSADIRQRVTDHIQLKLLLASHRNTGNQSNV